MNLGLKMHQNSKSLWKTDPEDSGDSGLEDTLRVMDLPINKFLEVGKEEEEPVFKTEICKGQKILYVAEFDTSYLKNVKIIRCRQANKRGN